MTKGNNMRLNPTNVISELKSYDDTVVVVDAGLIAFVTVSPDVCTENPCDWDGTGKIYSFSRRHNNYLRDFDFPASKIECREAIAKKYGGDVVFLGYYAHGQCQWFVEGCGGPGTDCRWDGVSFAGIWVPDKYLCKEASYRLKLKKGTPARDAKMIEWAKQACSTYTDWCNGEVYGYSIEVYKARFTDSGDVYNAIEDYRYDTAIAEESCFGFYGDDIKTGLSDGLEEVTAMLEKGTSC